MARFGPGLEKRQAVLFRLVDVGAELFAMAATCVHAHALVQAEPGQTGPLRLADLYCRHARRIIRESFRNVFDNDDRITYRVAQEVLQGKHAWLERDVRHTASRYGSGRRSNERPRSRAFRSAATGCAPSPQASGPHSVFLTSRIHSW